MGRRGVLSRGRRFHQSPHKSGRGKSQDARMIPHRLRLKNLHVREIDRPISPSLIPGYRLRQSNASPKGLGMASLGGFVLPDTAHRWALLAVECGRPMQVLFPSRFQVETELRHFDPCLETFTGSHVWYSRFLFPSEPLAGLCVITLQATL